MVFGSHGVSTLSMLSTAGPGVNLFLVQRSLCLILCTDTFPILERNVCKRVCIHTYVLQGYFFLGVVP